jgi:hypothetical protein
MSWPHNPADLTPPPLLSFPLLLSLRSSGVGEGVWKSGYSSDREGRSGYFSDRDFPHKFRQQASVESADSRLCYLTSSEVSGGGGWEGTWVRLLLRPGSIGSFEPWHVPPLTWISTGFK